MKTIFTCLLSTALAFGAAAQVKTKGKVVYNEKMKMEMGGEMKGMADLPPDMQKKIEEMMKKMEKKKRLKVLYFNPEESLYMNAPEEDKEAEQLDVQEGGIRMKMEFGEDDMRVYKNVKAKEVLRQEDFMGKRFLVNDEVEGVKWKLENETKEILGYSCKKAWFVTEEKGDTVTAWYTSQIPVSAGPLGVGELPGLVLESTMADGKLTVTAEKIDFDTDISAKLLKPSSGKKISAEKFEKIRKEKEAEMKEFEGGDGNFQIQIRHN